MAESDDITAQDARAAAEIQADVGVEHVANIYAEALLGAGEAAGCTAELLDEFNALFRDVLDPFSSLDEILASGLISHDEKAGILDRVFGGQLSPMMVSFLKVVSRHGRLDCLRAIHRQTKLQYDRLRGRVRVELITAMPIGDATADRIGDGLRQVIGGEPIVQHRTDPELIGGAVLRVGDTVYDGSIANQLRLIRQQMIDRSAHEIQSRRDRFRDPAGD